MAGEKRKNHSQKRKTTLQDVADYFLALSNETGDFITNLRLQKLVYYAQAWHLANYSKPLFNKEFEAWVHGPANSILYRKYKKYGCSPIKTNLKLKQVQRKFDSQTIKFLQEVARVYMSYTPFQLEMMAHQEEPWIRARKNYAPDEKCNVIISKKSMKEYYGAKIKD